MMFPISRSASVKIGPALSFFIQALPYRERIELQNRNFDSLRLAMVLASALFAVRDTLNEAFDRLISIPDDYILICG